jgi:PIN domain nuclease of toxin-antitoxin system
MQLLLDTQVWLWMTEAPDRLSPTVRRLVSPTDNQCFLSAVTVWEIAIKYRIGKLRLPGIPATVIPPAMERTDVLPLPVLHKHALHVGTLPLHHRDPFDRLLIAQAQLEDLTIVTSDRAFERYDVTVKRA